MVIVPVKVLKINSELLFNGSKLGSDPMVDVSKIVWADGKCF